MVYMMNPIHWNRPENIQTSQIYFSSVQDIHLSVMKQTAIKTPFSFRCEF